MKYTKEMCSEFFAIQFSNALPGLTEKAPYASFGPVVLKYEPVKCGMFKELHYRVYLFDGKDKSLKSGKCPIGKLTPVVEKAYDYMPLYYDVWDEYGDQITEQINNFMFNR